MTQGKQIPQKPNEPQHTNEIVNEQEKRDERSKPAFSGKALRGSDILWMRVSPSGIIHC